MKIHQPPNNNPQRIQTIHPQFGKKPIRPDGILSNIVLPLYILSEKISPAEIIHFCGKWPNTSKLSRVCPVRNDSVSGYAVRSSTSPVFQLYGL